MLAFYSDKIGQWRWHIVANGRTISATTEGYNNKVDCIRAAIISRDSLIQGLK